MEKREREEKKTDNKSNKNVPYTIRNKLPNTEVIAFPSISRLRLLRAKWTQHTPLAQLLS